MEKPQTVSELIERMGGANTLKNSSLNMSYTAIRRWAEVEAIPAWHWRGVVRVAKGYGIVLTVADVQAMHKKEVSNGSL